ncbi:MAG: S9 family peptidase [Lentimicrobium sp.]|jgi:dipeptidyl-peptidase-4|nr:S9 family peptidase [Lentimicrobium sp.]
MNRLIALFALLFTGLQLSFAQDKILVPEEIMSNRQLYPTGLSNLQWRGSTDNYTWQVPDGLLQGSIKDEITDTLLRVSTLNEALVRAGFDELQRLPYVTWASDKVLEYTRGENWFAYDLEAKSIKLLNTTDTLAENAEMAPETNYIAYTKNNNLYVSTGTEQITVTNDENTGIVNGQTVHRNEFGIEKGIFWSPKGNLLAFYRMDETMVTEYPLVDITPRVAEVKNIRYPMAGMASHQVTLGVYNPKTRSKVFMKTGLPAEQYLTNIAWSPDEKLIYIAVLNRDQNHMKLNCYNAETGAFIKTLFEETNDRYVEPQHPMVFVPGNPNQFIWQSQRDGFNHLYLYDTDGKLIKQLTSGSWIITEFLGFNPDGTDLFYTSTAVSPLENQLYHLNIKSGKSSRLTMEMGTHNPIVRKDGKYFIDRYSNREVPAALYLSDTKAKRKKTLHQSPNPLKDFKPVETTIFTLKADEGTDLYCRLIKPADFDTTKKYPAFIYVYGGPHAQLITESWLGGANLFLDYMAQLGFVVFTLDNRGSANRGFAFESIIHRNLGTLEVADQMKGVEYLKTLPFVDPERIGVDGWSYGGFMAISLKLKNPGIFKVASAGGPVIDWKYYEVMYGERYMDTPEQNTEGYKEASLLNHVDKLEGKLLVIHGNMDNTVVWQNSLDFLMTCITNKKQVDYFVYPTHEHNVGGIDRAHLFRKLSEYYLQNL